MKFFCFVVVPAFLAISLSAQSPSIAPDGVVNAASYLPSGLPGSGIAQGSFFLVEGTGLGPSTLIFLPGLPFPTSLGGTSIQVTVGATTVDALMYYASANQVAAILPSVTPTGNGTLKLTSDGGSTTAPIQVVKSAFGIFTLNSAGAGPAVVTNNVTNAVNSLRGTSKPGDVVVLWGSGLGPFPGSASDEANGQNLVGDLREGPDGLIVHVYVANKDATILYAGRSGYSGEDQIDFTVPDGVAGCYLPVTVSVNGVVGNFASLSVDPNGETCSDPFGLTSSQIEQAATGQLSVGSLLLLRDSLDVGVGAPITEDTALANFYQFDGTNPYASPERSPDLIGFSSFGSCSVTVCRNQSSCNAAAATLPLPKLDAGSDLEVSGSLASSPPAMLSSQTNGSYFGYLGSYPLVIPPFTTKLNYLQPGTFSFSGAGGANVNAFDAAIVVPGNLNWTNANAVGASISRAQDLTVTWSGGGAGDYVAILVSSATNAATYPAGQYNTASVSCLANATDGSFTIPSWILESLPISSLVPIGSISPEPPGGAVSIGIFNFSNTFNGNLDLNLANSLVLSGKAVTID